MVSEPFELTVSSSFVRFRDKVAQLSSDDQPPSRSVVDDLASQMRAAYQDLHASLGNLQTTQSDSTVHSRLDNVERQLTAAQALLEARDSAAASLSQTLGAELRAEVAETAALAEGAATDALMAGQEAAQAAQVAAGAAAEAASVSTLVQELRLGLEVVEQSLEDLDVTDTLTALRSRMDDLDAGIERSAEEALAKVSDLERTVHDMRRIAERADMSAADAEAKATAAAAAAVAATEDVADLRREVQAARAAGAPQAGGSLAGSAPSSVPTSPSQSAASDPRLKAAVHTLSDGYRSLHRAMSLMYEEQAEVAAKVSAVGAAAQQAQQAQHIGASRVKTLNVRDARALVSFPLCLSPRSLDGGSAKRGRNAGSTAQPSVDAELAEMKAMLAAQAAETAQQARRAEALEAEVAAMRQLLCGLAPSLPAPAPVQPAAPKRAAAGAAAAQEGGNGTIKAVYNDDVEAVSVLFACDDATGKVNVALEPKGRAIDTARAGNKGKADPLRQVAVAQLA